MRKKENAEDYRYFPEPDLPVFCPDEAFLKSVDGAMVELPRPRIRRMMASYGLSPEQAELICDEKEGADYFEQALAAVPAGQAGNGAFLRAANWFLTDIKHILGREGIAVRDIASFRLTPRRFAALTLMAESGRITGKTAKQTLELVIAEDRDPEDIVQERGWEQLTDPAVIARAAETVFAAETDTVTELRALLAAGDGGKEKRRRTLQAYLVGKVLAATGGRADPKIAGESVDALLGNC
jgi:aspartyl-tRNA(Asn)/glutamyl-tRNA(Gln) amidotransferase subunit B